MWFIRCAALGVGGAGESAADGRRRFGPEPRCDTRCHSACALSFALIVDEPFSLVEEMIHAVTRWIRERTVR